MPNSVKISLLNSLESNLTQACSHPHIVLILVLTTTERREEWAYGMI